ncbi:MAG: HAMP domain-containing protein [Anaerolineae bacterium]|nr:HAMP domain-containing protein [Anaerolineae bacterium]
MRLRLFLAFVLLIVVTLTAVAVFTRQEMAVQVRSFIGRGGWMGVEGHVADLESFYRQHGTWEGVEALFDASGRGERGQGQGGGRGPHWNELRLADVNGLLVYAPAGMLGAGFVSEEELRSAVPIEVDGARVGYLLPGGSPPSEDTEDALLEVLYRASLKSAWIAALLALALSLLMVSLLLRPLNQLTRAAKRMAQGDLTQRVSVGGARELSQLGEAFNRMAAALQAAETRRRALTADIAHELRNPLAVQRAHLEALQDGVYPLNLENLGVVLHQNLLLTRLVEDLRTLALADAGELVLMRRETDLAQLVEDVVEQFKSQAVRRDIHLHCDLSSACPLVNVDPERIQQILNNLLQNALRHTPQSGEVSISLRCEAGAAVLSVRDSGAGIPPEAMERIFERFYRVDSARSREDGGSGLGLAIARRLAELHGGTLQARNHPLGGAEFILSLPV